MKISLRKAIILIVLAVFLVIALGIGIIKIKNINKKETEDQKEEQNIDKETDSLKFKKEWEALNGTVRELDGENYNSVNISEDNPIKYINVEELLNIIDNEDAYIYISNETCPYCRQTIETLLQVAKDLKIDTIYYFGLGQNTYSVKNNNYEQLMQKLIDKGLVIKRENNKIAWRIPMMLKTRDGEIVSKIQSLAIKFEEGQSKYDKLTNEQLQEVYNHYYEGLSK